MRLLRLEIGIFFIVQGIAENDKVVAFMGLLLSIMPILNIGCCGASACSMPVCKTNGKNG